MTLQDSRLHEGNGVFLHIVHLLQNSEHPTSQSLAADLIQAMLSDECALLGHGGVPPSAIGLAASNAAFRPHQLLQLVGSSSSAVKVVCYLQPLRHLFKAISLLPPDCAQLQSCRAVWCSSVH